MLVDAFIVDNLLLIAASFYGALMLFLHTQKLLLAQYFKVGQYSLSLEEIRPELELIAASLVGCVLLSAIPIIIAAHKEIGRVLK